MFKAVTAEIEVNAGLEQVHDWLTSNRAAAFADTLAGGGAVIRTGLPLRAQRALSCRITLQREQGATLDGVLSAVASPYPGRPLAVSFSGRASGQVSEAAASALALGLLGALAEPDQVAA